MNCDELRELMHGYLDGEVDLVRNLAIERHLSDCANCAGAYRGQQELRGTLKHPSLYFAAPAGLQARLAANLRQIAKTEQPTSRRSWSWNLTWPAIFAPLGVAALAMLLALPLVGRHSAQNQLASEVVSAHVRSLMLDTGHLTDVASSDQHTVKPWFTGKLSFAPTVIDLATQGFPLIGGRLDYFQDHPVAALVYQRRKHLINVFIWPTTAGPRTSTAVETLQGYNVVHWNQVGMTYWAVSDVGLPDLQQFVDQLRNGTSSR